MSIVVTAATGQLGRLVVESLLKRGAPANDIVATGRDTAKLADFSERGVQVRSLDYADPASVREVLGTGDRVLLVSGNEFGQRVAQHRNVIDAAKDAGVALLAYTSIANADRTSLAIAADHQTTEQAIRESAVPYALLRNSWYFENYTPQLPLYVQHGAVFGSAGEGRISGASRADYADAAATVLLGGDHGGAVYELGGDEAFTLAELAAEVARATGSQVAYRDLPVEDYQEMLMQAGLPEDYAAVLASSDEGIGRGDLFVATSDLSRLIGRPTTSLAEAVGSAAVGAGLSA
jgi:NAD(P)H dehydrogenase (quinone)